MAAERGTRLRLLKWMRLLLLTGTGVRHARKLVRLGAGNASVLGGYQRACRGIAGRRLGARAGNVWLPLKRYVSLFRPYPALESADDARERERLARTYAEATALSERQRPAVDPVSAPSALRLQARFVQRAFTRLFDLRLTPREERVLAGYGSVAQAAREFLEYCGAATGMAPSAPLALQLPGFVIHAELRHARMSSRGRMLAVQQDSAASGRIRSWWARLCHVVARAYWSRGDAAERIERLAMRVNAHKEERLAVMRALKNRVDPATQETLVAILADQMHLRGALLLAEISEQTRRALEADGGATIEQLSRQEFEFMRAAHGLEENLRAALRR